MITIKTYQDLLEIGKDEKARMDFVMQVIKDHIGSQEHRIAEDAEQYYRHLNPTIMRAQKLIYNLLGQAVQDNYSANNKIPCRYYFYFVTQAVQFLLGNGVSFSNDGTKKKLGKGFDKAVQRLATKAINGGAAYGFWNKDHIEIMGISNTDKEPAFAPLYDEDNGALRAGVRYWQVDSSKPIRATLFEEDGFTEYIKRKDEDMQVYAEKRDYIQIVESSEVSGTTIYNGGNYPGFPVIPLYNINKQSELVGNRETIDAYDLMVSALVNNVDEGNLIYWVLKNCGGMDDIDDVKFVERLKTLHVAHADGDGEGSSVEAHTIEAPFEANEATLERLRSQLFDDFMALDVKAIAGGAATATQIEAAYEPLNSKADLFEHQVTEFIDSLLALLGIEDKPTYTRSMIVNQQEMIQNILSAASYLSEEYVTKKILEVLGDADKAEDVLAQKVDEDMGKYEVEETLNGGQSAQPDGQEAGGNGEAPV